MIYRTALKLALVACIAGFFNCNQKELYDTAKETPPTVVITSPQGGIYVGGSQIVSADAADQQAMGRVEFYINGIKRGEALGAPYQFLWDTTADPDGGAVIYAIAYDSFGNITQSPNVTVTVDHTSPAITLAASSLYDANQTVITANPSDNGSGINRVDFYIDGVLTASAAASPFVFTLMANSYSDGVHQVSAKAVDRTGNSSNFSNVLNITVDKTPPTITISASNIFTTILSIITPSIGESGSGIGQVDYYVNGNPAGSFTTSPYSLNLTHTLFGEGKHNVYARVVDRAGNSSISDAIDIVLDTNTPTVAIISPGNNDGVYGNVVVAATASDDHNYSIKEVEFNIGALSSGPIGSPPYQFVWDANSASEGNYTITAIAKDQAGNTASASITVYIRRGIVVAGSHYQSLTLSDWCIKKFDHNGIESADWNIISDYNNLSDKALAMAVDSKNHIYVAGYVTVESNQTAWQIRKYFANASLDWVKTFPLGPNNNARINALAVDSNDNVYAVGNQLISGGPTGLDWWIKKFGPDGNEISSWDKVIDSNTAKDDARAVAIDSLGNVYVGGAGFGDLSDYNSWWIKKFDPNGVEDTTNWNKVFAADANNHNIHINDIAIDHNNNVYVSGCWPNLAYDNAKAWYTKRFLEDGNEIIQGDLNSIYSLAPGNNAPEEIWSIALDSNNALYAAGNTWDGITLTGSIRKYDVSTGVRLSPWDVVDINASGDEVVRSIKISKDNNIYLVGQQKLSTWNQWLVQKLAPDTTGKFSKLLDSVGDSTAHAVVIFRE